MRSSVRPARHAAPSRQLDLAGRAAHPALARAAVALFACGLAIDVVGSIRALTWLSFYAMAIGVALGAWGVAFAAFDWAWFAEWGNAGAWGLAGIPTAAVVGLNGMAVLLRLDSPWHAAPPSALAVEVAGAALLATKTWLGRELAGSLSSRRRER